MIQKKILVAKKYRGKSLEKACLNAILDGHDNVVLATQEVFNINLRDAGWVVANGRVKSAIQRLLRKGYIEQVGYRRPTQYRALYQVQKS